MNARPSSSPPTEFSAHRNRLVATINVVVAGAVVSVLVVSGLFAAYGSDSRVLPLGLATPALAMAGNLFEAIAFSRKLPSSNRSPLAPSATSYVFSPSRSYTHKVLGFAIAWVILIAVVTALAEPRVRFVAAFATLLPLNLVLAVRKPPVCWIDVEGVNLTIVNGSSPYFDPHYGLAGVHHVPVSLVMHADSHIEWPLERGHAKISPDSFRASDGTTLRQALTDRGLFR